MHTKKKKEEESNTNGVREEGEKKEGIELVCEISLLDASYVIRSGIYEP
jgi:hypothetical protein